MRKTTLRLKREGEQSFQRNSEEITDRNEVLGFLESNNEIC